MLNLILYILPLAVMFACGYGVRDWMSRRRRKKARRRRYERQSTIPKPDELAPKIETNTNATGREPTIRELHERLSRVEDRIFDTGLKTELVPELEHSNNNGGVVAFQTTAQWGRRSD
jgi:hypothetical protein